MLDHPPDGLCVKVVLPVRIELTTSALPRMRSTTELRQHFRKADAYEGPGLALSTRRSHVGAMAGKDKQREERLAAALRENLRKRKEQARAASSFPRKRESMNEDERE